MAKSLSVSLALAINGLLENTLDVGKASYPIEFRPSVQLTNGSGAGQASAMFTDTRTLAASATEDLDLNGTALTDALGVAIGLTKIKAIAILAAAGNTNDVVVGGAASNAVASIFGTTADTIKIKPGGFLVLAAPSAAGYGVTATTADLLKIANGSSGSAVTYTIVIIGS